MPVLGSKLENSYYLRQDSEDEKTMKDFLKFGLENISISHMYDTSQPKLLAGSIITVNGVTYTWDTDTSAMGIASDGVMYLYITENGTFSQTNLIYSSWDPFRQGYYRSNNRYIARMTKSGTSWTDKVMMNKAFRYRVLLEELDTSITAQLDQIISDINYFM